MVLLGLITLRHLESIDLRVEGKCEEAVKVGRV